MSSVLDATKKNQEVFGLRPWDFIMCVLKSSQCSFNELKGSKKREVTTAFPLTTVPETDLRKIGLWWLRQTEGIAIPIPDLET